MLMIFTALYCEAEPFIRFYKLKKQRNFHSFQIYAQDDIFLLITNTGSIKAAIGVAYLCSNHIPGPSDRLFNIGVCGCKKKDVPVGSAFLCNKIHEQGTGRCYYPDMCYTHPFHEDSIVSCQSIVNHTSNIYLPETLVDMEAAAIFQAGSVFYRPDQMFFVKVVSDHLEDKRIKPERITCLMQENLSSITGWMHELHQESTEDSSIFSPEEKHSLEKVGKKLRLSVTMIHQLYQMMHYYKLQNGSFTARVDAFLKTNQPLPCKTKKEGKECFEQLKKEFIKPPFFSYIH